MKDLRVSLAQRLGLSTSRQDCLGVEVGASATVTNTIYSRYVKRGMDVALGLLALPLMLPLLAVVAIVVRRDGGPVIFGHLRVGRDGKPFSCLKIRTMQVDAKEALERLLQTDPLARAEWEQHFKLKNDPRITKIGGLLRKTSLDELPQIFNVLKGDMSFVGPRPITDEELAKYGETSRYYLAVRPGLTGPWQVTDRRTNVFEARARLDADYAKNVSFLKDAYYLLATVPEVIFCHGK